MSIFLYQSAVYAFKYLKSKTNEKMHSHNERNKSNIHVLHHERKSIIFSASFVYNKLPDEINNTGNLKAFKLCIKK